MSAKPRFDFVKFFFEQHAPVPGLGGGGGGEAEAGIHCEDLREAKLANHQEPV